MYLEGLFMRIFIKILRQFRAGAAVIAAFAAVLMLIGPLSATDNDKADIAESAPTQIQQQEQADRDYYDEQTRAAQERADELDRADAIYYQKQAERAKARAEKREREAAE